jgi:O-antigen/teichoic acid export membrane protein
MFYLKARLIQASLEVTLCVGIIVLFSATSEARILSYVAALAVSCIVGLRYCTNNNYVPAKVTKAHLLSMATFGLPMLPHIVAGTVINNMDRALVSSILGFDSLGIYMAAMQIGMAMILIVDPLNRALAPWLYEQLFKNDPRIRFVIVRNTYCMYAVLLLIGGLWTLLSMYFFENFIGSQYVSAKSLIPWMVAGFTFQGMYYSVVNYIFYAEKSGRLSIATTLTATIGCVLSYLLIRKLGLRGACISFALNNCLLFLIVWLVASRSVSMPWLLRNRP